jgi:Hemerythrin HHE cation binding domain
MEAPKAKDVLMTSPPSNPARIAAFSRELSTIHNWLRHELADIRAAAADGSDHTSAMPLGAHCLAFCSAMTTHHRGEDDGAFPALARKFPDLGGTIAKLEEDHVLIAELLDSIRDLVAGLPELPSPAQVRQFVLNLDGLTAILESHFRYEERSISAGLDQLSGISGKELFGDIPQGRLA